jgi:hypothetical protein
MTDLLERLATRAQGRSLTGNYVVTGEPTANEVGAQVDGLAADGSAVWIRFLSSNQVCPDAPANLAKLATYKHPAYPVYLGHGIEEGDHFLVERALRGTTAASQLARARAEGRGAPAFFVVDPDETMGRTGNIPHEPYWRAICRIVTELGRCAHGLRAHGVAPTAITPESVFYRLDGNGIVRTLGLVGASIEDPREEVAAMGRLLYELTTLESPVPVATRRARPPRDIEPRINAKLETIILAATAKPLSARYRDVGALAADLDTYLMHRPIAARRPNWLGRILGKPPSVH